MTIPELEQPGALTGGLPESASSVLAQEVKKDPPNPPNTKLIPAFSINFLLDSDRLPEITFTESALAVYFSIKHEDLRKNKPFWIKLF